MRVILPLTDAPLDATPAHGIRAPVKVEEKVVLVVEDQREVRELVTSMLQNLGAEVLVADGPAQALHLAKERKAPIHLLLTDVVMPDMNGRVLAGRIRQLRPETRVLYMSAWLGDELQGEVGSELDAPLLHKPFQPGDLLSKLHEVLSPEG
jgi:two-component system cell cycle sensor histidine kinase/response regulator CckA